MSVVGRRQLSSNERAYKYEFNLELLNFKCHLPLPCKVKFMWKRNSKSIETKHLLDVPQGGFHDLTIQEKLSSISTIIYNTDKRAFMAKESELIVIMLFEGSPKKLGYFHIDMKSILDPHQYQQTRSELFDVPLTITSPNNLTKDARISFKLTSTFKEEVSAVGGQKSVSGSLNMSGMSMPFDAKYLKYDAPSKDNHSVSSYNPGLVRYSSISKREKEDTSSIRREQNRRYDYGYVPSMRSNITNEYDIKSAKKSADINEAGSNKQLQEEQGKRSKLEAELNKHKVQSTQLKKNLNELSIENLKLKEEVTRLNTQAQYSSSEQSNALQEVKELREQLAESHGRKQQQQDVLRSQIRTQSSMVEQLRHSLKEKDGMLDDMRRSEGSRRVIQEQNSELRFQLENQRRLIDELKRQQEEREATLLNDKHRRVEELTMQLDQANRDLDKARQASRQSDMASRELEELQGRLQKYENEKVFMQKEIIRLKSEINEKRESEGQFSRREGELLTELQAGRSERVQLMGQLEYLRRCHEDRQRQVLRGQEERTQWESKNNNLLLQHNQQQGVIQSQRQQIDELKNYLQQAEQHARYLQDQLHLNAQKSNEQEQKAIQELQQQVRILTVKIEESERQRAILIHQKAQLDTEVDQLRQEQQKRMNSSTVSPQMDRLMRESLQMQMELKYAKEEVERLRGAEEAMEELRWRADNDKKERESMEEECERLGRELAGKNRALLIEVEKGKMTGQQFSQSQQQLQAMKQELERNNMTISNGQQQLTALEQELAQACHHNEQLKAECLNLEQAIVTAEQSRSQVQVWQQKVAELEQRNSQKLASLETVTRSNAEKNNEIRQLQALAEQRQRQLAVREKQLEEEMGRIKELEQRKQSFEGELTRATHEKKMAEKREQMIMEEMYGMKKKLEEERGRSVSSIRNEETDRIRRLQSENEKKDKMISRVSKDNIKLEEENVTLNVQIMKLLSERERTSKSQSQSSRTLGKQPPPK